MEKEYYVEMRIVVNEEDLEKYRNVQDMIYESMADVPFSFDITDCRKI